jgi:tRNA(adenine34) deaminase
MDDMEFMAEAYKEAEAARDRGECPVGAVLVHDGKIIARGGNEELEHSDATAHAEILVMRRAGKILGRHMLPDCTVYTTLWPCPLCDAAMLQAQIPRVVSGATPFAWSAETRFNKKNLTREGPLMQEDCRAIFIQWLRDNDRHEILEREGL